MTKQDAAKLKQQAEADSRITARILGAGEGFRVQLILRNGKRRLEIGKVSDLPLILSLWEGL